MNEWTDWKRKWPDKAGYWWEWKPGDEQAYMTLIPERWIKDKPGGKPSRWYKPVQLPELPKVGREGDGQEENNE